MTSAAQRLTNNDLIRAMRALLAMLTGDIHVLEYEAHIKTTVERALRCVDELERRLCPQPAPKDEFGKPQEES